MYVSRATPTLTGQQQGAYDALTTSSLAVTGNASVAGLTNLAALTGSAITDLLTMSSSTTAASAKAVSMLNTNMNAFLPLTGGAVSGPLAVSGMLYASNISVLGSFETVRAYETHSSNVVIDSLGTGPALRVTQTEGGALGAQPCAEFYNGGDPALVIGWDGSVAINKPTAGFELDVSGVVHASGGFVGNGSGLTGLASASAWNTSLTNVYIGAGSNVGIGTTPATGYALDVSGVIRSTGGFSRDRGGCRRSSEGYVGYERIVHIHACGEQCRDRNGAIGIEPLFAGCERECECERNNHNRGESAI